jgi:hypothetical protein
VINNNGRPRKNYDLKKSQLFIQVLFFERRIQSIFIKDIYFAALWALVPVVAAPLALTNHHRSSLAMSLFISPNMLCKTLSFLNYFIFRSNLRNLFVPVHCRHVSEL